MLKTLVVKSEGLIVPIFLTKVYIIVFSAEITFIENSHGQDGLVGQRQGIDLA